MQVMKVEMLSEKTGLSMLKERNNTAHIYDGEAANRLLNRILEEYILAFIKVQESIIDKL